MTAFKNLNRYTTTENSDGTHTVIDTRNSKPVANRDGETNLSERDAHDLREEYRWS